MLSRKTGLIFSSLFATCLLLAAGMERIGRDGSTGGLPMDRMLLYPGWLLLALLMLLTFVIAVRYFDTLQDMIAKMLHHDLVPFLASCTLLLSFALQLRRVKLAAVSPAVTGDDGIPQSGFESSSMLSANLIFNANIVLFCVSFAILCGWWAVEKRKN